jgi:hypothetical protein
MEAVRVMQRLRADATGAVLSDSRCENVNDVNFACSIDATVKLAPVSWGHLRSYGFRKSLSGAAFRGVKLFPTSSEIGDAWLGAERGRG